MYTEAAKEKARTRLYELLALQRDVEARFGDTDYNVFIFGSYPTVRYVEGRSDIDIAIYTKDFSLYKQLAVYLEDYFEDKHVDTDIFYIDTSVEAPIFCAPLKSALQFTDYFPEELKAFEERCQVKLNETKVTVSSRKDIRSEDSKVSP